MATARSIVCSTPEKLCEELNEFVNDAIKTSLENNRMIGRVFFSATHKDGEEKRIYCRIDNDPIVNRLEVTHRFLQANVQDSTFPQRDNGHADIAYLPANV